MSAHVSDSGSSQDIVSCNAATKEMTLDPAFKALPSPSITGPGQASCLICNPLCYLYFRDVKTHTKPARNISAFIS
jgi:hypothetical protein